jgi:hypothetical protein
VALCIPKHSLRHPHQYEPLDNRQSRAGQIKSPPGEVANLRVKSNSLQVPAIPEEWY